MQCAMCTTFLKSRRPIHTLSLQPKTAEKKRVLLNRMIDREQRLRDKLADMGIEYEFPGYAGAAAKVCKTDAAVAVTEEKVKAKTPVTAKKTATKAATPAAKQEVAPPTPTQTATPATKKTATKKATPAKKEDAEPVATPVVMKRKQEDKTEKAPASTAAKKVKKDVVAPKKASAAKKTTRKATA